MVVIEQHQDVDGAIRRGIASTCGLETIHAASMNNAHSVLSFVLKHSDAARTQAAGRRFYSGSIVALFPDIGMVDLYCGTVLGFKSDSGLSRVSGLRATGQAYRGFSMPHCRLLRR